MNLVLFDIDGTLTVSDGVGRACFVRALEQTFGILGQIRRWSEFPHVTDTGITCDILREHRGCEPGGDDVARQHAAYHSLLRQALLENPDAYEAVPGAVDALALLRASPRWTVGIASGNWREAGWMKLQSAGFAGLPMPAGYADDAVERHLILKAAIAAANADPAGRRTTGFRSVVYVGDAPWDLHAARAAGIGFVGVCTDVRRRAALRSAGAADVFSCYTDFAAFERALHEAAQTAPT